jgi:ribosomal protein S18 acetylase RimI-like enzyme
MKGQIRAIAQADIEGLKNVLDTIELFPSEYLEEMMSDYLTNPETHDSWFTCIYDNKPVAIGYCVPEKFTEGTYNLLAIGVAQEAQRKGIASEMMQFIEQQLRHKEARILLVETSSANAQAGARNLYKHLGYTQEAIIRDFWKEGEDKLVFWKKLNGM